MLSDEDDFAVIDSTQPELSETGKQSRKYIELPEKSREKYEALYGNFMKWNKINKSDQPFSEDTLITYFNELSVTKKSSTLWALFSMLKSTIWLKHRVDIKKYTKLNELLRNLSIGWTPNVSPALPEEGIEKFLKEAPDYDYLSIKVALIFAITGGCKSKTLIAIKTKHIEQNGEMLLIKYPNSKNRYCTFVIHGENYETVKKYEALRPKHTNHDRFFIQYYNGKCSRRPIGFHMFSAMPKKIAIYLGLPNPESYTAHSFKQSYITLQKGLGQWVAGKRKFEDQRSEISKPHGVGVHSESHLSTAEKQDPFSSHENTMSSINVKSNPISRISSPSDTDQPAAGWSVPCEDGDTKIFTKIFQTPDNNVTFYFKNCRFFHCFNK